MRITESCKSLSSDRLDPHEMQKQALFQFGVKYNLKTARGQFLLCKKYLKNPEGRDLISATYWLKISARSGYAKAQYLLGKLYSIKPGKNHFKKSYKWTYLSAQQGHQQAIKTLEEIKNSLHRKSEGEIHSLLGVNKR